jgi:O-antigen/teichoic acid export membrane protein
MIIRSGILSYLIQIQNVVLQLLISMFLARFFGPENYGLYVFTFTIISLFYLMHNSVINNITVRYGAKYWAEKKIRELKGLVRFGISLTIIYGILVAVIIYGGLTLATFKESGVIRRDTLYIACMSIITFPLMSYVGTVLRVLNKGIIGQCPEYIIRPWVFIALVLTAYFMIPESLDVNKILIYQTVAALTAFLVAVVFLHRQKKWCYGDLENKYHIKTWCNAAVPFLLMGGVMLINTQADIVMLGLMSSPETTGMYKVALNFANIVGLSLAATNLYLSPKVSSLYETGKIEELQLLLSKFSKWSFFMALMPSILFLLVGENILNLVFGSDYTQAYGVLSILIVGQLLNVMFGSVGMVLNMTGNQSYAARIAGMAAILNIVMNLIMIPNFGGEGAAVSTAVTLFIWNSLMYKSVKINTKLNPSILGILNQRL